MGAARPPTAQQCGGSSMAIDIGNGVLLEATTEGSGTGNYDSFLRLQATGIEEGFNTDQNGNVLDNKASFTHSLLYGDIQSIDVGGTQYLEFRLDLNESNNATNGTITLTNLQIYISGVPAGFTDFSAGSLGFGFTSIFDLGPDQLLVDANHGSGTDDYRILVPVSLFGNVPDGSYLTLVSGFSGSNGGFEEWRTLTKPGTGTDAPGIGIDKVTVDGSAIGDGLQVLSGDTITWQYTVSNTGNVALSNIVVTDDHNDVVVTPVLSGGFNVGDTNQDGKLDTTEHWSFIGTSIDKAVIGDYANTGTVTGSAGAVTVTDSDGSSYFGADPEIKIDKVTVDDGVKGDTLTILTNEPISWEYTVTNIGNVALSGITVTDSDGGVTPVAVLGNGHVTNIGDSNDNNMLDAGEIWKFSATGTSVAGPYSNTGTASGSFTDDANHTRTATATDDSGYTGADPHITLDKKTNGVDHGLNIFQGQPVTWTYDVKNDGNVALAHVVVTDDNGTAGTGDDFHPTAILSGGFNSGDINQNGLLDTNETWHYQATGVAQLGNYVNNATATTDAFVDTALHSRTPLATDSSDYEGFSNKALTQGFWGSHADAWDNIAGNEGNPTKSAVASHVLSGLDVNPRTDGYLLLGDSNGDGIANDAHDLLISNALAKSIESSSTGGDARVIMLQQAIATQLNIDNHVGQPNDLIDEAVMWLTKQGAWSTVGVNVDTNNDGVVDENGAHTALTGAAVKTSSAAWTSYVDVTDPSSGITDWNGGKEADGEGLKNALMWFNQGQLVTSGPGGHVAWFDGTNIVDEHPNTLDQFWLTLHQVGGLTGIA
ncbi:hypothetical protein EN845_11145 [Mesorhizobium sp. M8A.F.Ca.ET.202.01.1.1]|nr:hypothetical protein EN845_11145 [Mesorhizobium sp. M8A.F.Ca.ET.202.01.1.1]TGR29856.1 hypothetical protein EN840_09210 [Mesorhizobium sp. M8A.F.Ca.ET.197.01.1.1]TGR47206.1 hypothetical protein EN842_22870 [bacterium M00.F.Ca.ET.199.01.1.1]TGR55227.1 hypothetical protein EN841_07980 [Mesorhizobium sp. M8A.F.Ca.ET.198.01.1.1]TGU36656.1 hypothetical protein EN799_13650 [bacterium M00.F.Ca.ET.156.01.1.1]TGV87844.1 hypothetical protein EN792_009895 [Mesorhizobium sp. M00.F.Ca.ET.149.01.1.1]